MLTLSFIVYIYILLRNVIYNYKGDFKKIIRINNYRSKYLMVYFLICIVNFKYTVNQICLKDCYFKIKKNLNRINFLIIIIYKKKPRK